MAGVTCANVTVVKDLLVAAAAVTGAIVGVFGLRTWQRQLHGQTKYNLSRRILIAAFQTRDRVRRVRNGLIWGGEVDAALKELGLPSDEENANQAVRRGESAVYQVRWQRVLDARMSLDVERVEAEVLWGSAWASCLAELDRVITDLSVELMNYLDAEARRPTDTPEWKRTRQLVFGSVDDEYDKRLTAAIERVENAVRPYLGR